FYLACFAAGARFCLTTQPLYRYRLRSDSLTALHSIDDLRRLQQVDRRLLREQRLAVQPGFPAALKRHRHSIDQRLQWRVVIDAVKRRDWPGALRASLQGWHVFTYVSGKLAVEVWRRLRWGRGSGRASVAET